MPTCPRCDGDGYKIVMEGDRPVKDSCYHCAETGKVSEAQLRSDKVQGLISQVAGRLCYKAEEECKGHPDGEDWAFHAAEAGCSLHEYRWGRLSAFELEVAEAISKLDEKHPEVVEALLELTDSQPERPAKEAIQKVAPEAKKEDELDIPESGLPF